jgi:hypothetical protein
MSGRIGPEYALPAVSVADFAKLAPLAQAVLDARDLYPESSLASLYDPDLMPTALGKAHAALDKAVDRLYRREAFTSDRERAEHLLGLYARGAIAAVSPTQ